MKQKISLTIVLFMSYIVAGQKSSLTCVNIPKNNTLSKFVPDPQIPKLNYNTQFEYLIETPSMRADALCQKYIDNMMNAYKRIKQTKTTPHQYRNIITKELPGAPVGHHCVYGQYMHLTRAQQEIGDTTAIFPDWYAARSCQMFIDKMRQKYDTPKYQDCIYSGHMYETRAEYNSALNEYMSHPKADIKEFEKNNFMADDLEPGAMIIVRRIINNSPRLHMIMYLGRGYIKNDEFIADSTGRHIYIAHNREKMGDLFKTWKTNNLFAVNTKKIALTNYEKESTNKIPTTIFDKKIFVFNSDLSRNINVLTSQEAHTL